MYCQYEIVFLQLQLQSDDFDGDVEGDSSLLKEVFHSFSPDLDESDILFCNEDFLSFSSTIDKEVTPSRNNGTEVFIRESVDLLCS